MYKRIRSPNLRSIMEKLILKKKEDKERLQDCIAYLLQYCDCLERDPINRKFCFDVAQKALFLYNLSPKSFGENKNHVLVIIIARINQYKQEGYHTEWQEL